MRKYGKREEKSVEIIKKTSPIFEFHKLAKVGLQGKKGNPNGIP